MTWKQIKRLNEERGERLTEMRSMLDKAEQENRDLSGEEAEKFNTLNSESESYQARARRLETLYQQEADGERREQQPGREDITRPAEAGVERRNDRIEAEERAQFTEFLRSGDAPLERRAITTSGMGVVGTRRFHTRFIDTMKAYNGVRQAGAEIITTAAGNELTVPTGDDTANKGRLVGEGATNTNEANPTLSNSTLNAYKHSSDWIKVSLEMIQDAAFDIESYIMRKGAERNGRLFNQLSTTGTGSNQPAGFVTGASAGKVAASTSALTYEEILDLIHSVDAAYRNMPGARIMLHDTTLAAIRKLKDSSGSYIWQPGQPGAPNQIVGFQYVVNNDMAELGDGASSSVMAFGDFGRYIIRDVAEPFIIRANEKFADSGLVGFMVHSRHDGVLADTAAVKLLNLAAA